MRILMVVLLAIPMLAGCFGDGDGPTADDAEAAVEAAWADYEAASGPNGDLVALDMRLDLATAFEGGAMDAVVLGDIGYHSDGFQMHIVFEELVASSDGESHEFDALAMDVTCIPGSVRLTTDGFAQLGADDLAETFPVSDCWDEDAFAEAFPDVDMGGLPLASMADAMRGEFGDGLRLEGASVTDEGIVGRYKVPLGSDGDTIRPNAYLDALVIDERLDTITMTLDQSFGGASLELSMVMEVAYGERTATPDHPA